MADIRVQRDFHRESWDKCARGADLGADREKFGDYFRGLEPGAAGQEYGIVARGVSGGQRTGSAAACGGVLEGRLTRRQRGPPDRSDTVKKCEQPAGEGNAERKNREHRVRAGSRAGGGRSQRHRLLSGAVSPTEPQPSAAVVAGADGNAELVRPGSLI